jgi:hypothetical protein
MAGGSWRVDGICGSASLHLKEILEALTLAPILMRRPTVEPAEMTAKVGLIREA